MKMRRARARMRNATPPVIPPIIAVEFLDLVSVVLEDMPVEIGTLPFWTTRESRTKGVV
jgi:hypothetical protein